jgi:DNA-directed RNA polymerase subunit M/transcription elongation factor TFIIS
MDNIIDTSITNNTIDELSKIISNNFAIIVEKSILKYSQEYAETNATIELLQPIYETKFVEIKLALIKNPKLIITNKDAEEIAFLSPAQLNNEKYQDLLKKKEIRDYKKNNIKTSDAFKCSKCKKSKCEVTQKQIRAGDEPPTTFVSCLECGHTFSFST